MQSNNDDKTDNAAMQTEYNAAIRDIHEKIEARKFQSYEIRDPYGILELLNIIDDTNATSANSLRIMRSRL